MSKPLWRRYICLALLLIVALIALDQGTKLAVDKIVGRDDALMQVTNTFHIHPYLHNEDSAAMQPISEESGIPVKVLLLLDAMATTLDVAVMFFFVYAADRFIFWDVPRKSYPKLTILLICLFISAMICSIYIDELCWGGSLDFLCIARDTELTQAFGDHIHTITAPRHKIYDLKDLYIFASMPLLLTRLILWLVSFFQLYRNDQTRRALGDKFRHPITNVRSMCAARKG